MTLIPGQFFSLTNSTPSNSSRNKKSQDSNSTVEQYIYGAGVLADGYTAFSRYFTTTKTLFGEIECVPSRRHQTAPPPIPPRKQNNIKPPKHNITTKYFTMKYLTTKYLTMKYLTMKYLTTKYSTMKYSTTKYLTTKYLTTFGFACHLQLVCINSC